ncbi:hypothetical protein GALMADRAFT_213965 [Galerina marginata CBS 339.88]|uniref:Uncharacterized protein n=1 Tax=Galerina marginata (strain CBS 339.88) TaxID=685588 RepID=A0A067SU87_GALM3|nr:hypothetical protein GALMADRAFT_213965 [Galerina marginata CBS 339.88]
MILTVNLIPAPPPRLQVEATHQHRYPQSCSAYRAYIDINLGDLSKEAGRAVLAAEQRESGMPVDGGGCSRYWCRYRTDVTTKEQSSKNNAGWEEAFKIEPVRRPWNRITLSNLDHTRPRDAAAAVVGGAELLAFVFRLVEGGGMSGCEEDMNERKEKRKKKNDGASSYARFLCKTKGSRQRPTLLPPTFRPVQAVGFAAFDSWTSPSFSEHIAADVEAPTRLPPAQSFSASEFSAHRQRGCLKQPPGCTSSRMSFQAQAHLGRRDWSERRAARADSGWRIIDFLELATGKTGGAGANGEVEELRIWTSLDDPDFECRTATFAFGPIHTVYRQRSFFPVCSNSVVTDSDDSTLSNHSNSSPPPLALVNQCCGSITCVSLLELSPYRIYPAHIASFGPPKRPSWEQRQVEERLLELEVFWLSWSGWSEDETGEERRTEGAGVIQWMHETVVAELGGGGMVRRVCGLGEERLTVPRRRQLWRFEEEMLRHSSNSWLRREFTLVRLKSADDLLSIIYLNICSGSNFDMLAKSLGQPSTFLRKSLPRIGEPRFESSGCTHIFGLMPTRRVRLSDYGAWMRRTESRERKARKARNSSQCSSSIRLLLVIPPSWNNSLWQRLDWEYSSNADPKAQEVLLRPPVWQATQSFRSRRGLADVASVAEGKAALWCPPTILSPGSLHFTLSSDANEDDRA